MEDGADCIDDTDRFRAGATRSVLGHRVMAPSTSGTFLRSFTFGRVCQLGACSCERAWGLDGAPSGTLIVDVDSTICQVHGYQKQGGAYGYNRVLGCHPRLATRADSGFYQDRLMARLSEPVKHGISPRDRRTNLAGVRAQAVAPGRVQELARPPVPLPLHPTYGSWMNLEEGWVCADDHSCL